MHTQRYIAAFVLPLLVMGMACGQAGETPVPQKEVQKQRQKEIQEAVTYSGSGFLGVSTKDMSPSLAREMNMSTKNGALVTDVVDDSPALKAGIAEDDVIIEFNGTAIDDAGDLIKAVRKADPGSKATVVVVRGTQKKTLQATLGKVPESHAFMFQGFPRVPAAPHMPHAVHVRVFRGSAHGLQLMDLNPQLREYFGAPEGKGVLVEKVEKRSAAKDAGFKAGDVILRVGKDDMEESDDIWEALKDVKGGDSAEVDILRKGSRMTLELEIDKDEDMDSSYFDWDQDSRHDDAIRIFKNESHKMKLDKLRLNEDLKKLQEELRSVGKEIRSRMEKLRNTLDRGLRQVVG